MKYGSEISSKHYLNRFTKAFNVRLPSSDNMTIEELPDDAVFEIVNLNNEQLYRDLALLEKCSYCLDEIVSNTQNDLFEIEKDGQSVYDNSIKAVLITKKSVKLLPGNSYLKSEKFSPDKLKHYVEYLHFIPLLDKNNHITATLIVSKVYDTKPPIHIIRNWRHSVPFFKEVLKALLISGLYDLLKNAFSREVRTLPLPR